MKARVTLILISLVVVLGLLLSGFGCGSQPTSAPAPAPSSAAAPKATTAPAPAASMKPVILKVTGSAEPNMPDTNALEKAQALIKDRSGGRISFEYHPGGSLYDLAAGSKAIMDNLVDLGSFKVGNFTDRFGLAAEQDNMPFNYPVEGFGARARDAGGFFDWISPYYEKNGTKLLSYYAWTPVDIWTRRPVRKLEDLKGQLIRTVPGGAATAFKLLGAEPVNLAIGEVYEGMIRGTIDGTNSSASSGLTRKNYEAVKFFTVCGFTASGHQIAMNLKVFNSLSPDLQKIVLDAFLETEKTVYRDGPAINKRDLEALKTKGVEVIILDNAEIARWRAKMQPMYDDLAKKYGEEWKKFSKIQDGLWGK